MLNEDGYIIFDIFDKKYLPLNKNIISNRDNDIKVQYYITEKESLVNTNVKVIQTKIQYLSMMYQKNYMILSLLNNY